MTTTLRIVTSAFIGAAATGLTISLGYGFWPGLWLSAMIIIVIAAIT